MDTRRLFLCAIDFSETCQGALGLACALARALGAELLLVHVRDPSPRSELRPERSRDELERALAPARTELEAWRLEAEKKLGRAVEAVLVEGSAAEEIAHVAEARSCELVVTGTQGRTGLGRLVVGSVAARVLREAPCSVLVLPHAAAPAELSRQICCAIDFSEVSRVALRQAAELARALGANLDLVHVPARAPGAPEMLAFGAPGVDARAEEELRRELSAWEAEAARLVGAAVVTAVRPGDAADEVLRYATERGAGLVVVGTHGRSGVKRLVLGSVAERVVREARVPVLVARERVRPPSAGAEEPDPDLPAGRMDHQRIAPFR
jgi:universal stress protein A